MAVRQSLSYRLFIGAGAGMLFGKNACLNMKQENKANKKILIIAATHGNEKIGVQIVNRLKKQGLDKYFDYLIGNPRALAKKREFIDDNLNRVYPGKKDSKSYEKRLAYKNLQVAKKYRYIIDIHEASKGKDDFIIVPREKTSPMFPLGLIDLKKIILWPDPKGPISQVLPKAVELEFGMKQRKRDEAIDKGEKILKKFIRKIYKGEFENGKRNTQEVYYVYGKLLKNELAGEINKMIDFKEFKLDKEKFLPLLSHQYLKHGIVCYKMKKII